MISQKRIFEIVYMIAYNDPEPEYFTIDMTILGKAKLYEKLREQKLLDFTDKHILDSNLILHEIQSDLSLVLSRYKTRIFFDTQLYVEKDGEGKWMSIKKIKKLGLQKYTRFVVKVR